MINTEDKVRLALQMLGIVMAWVSGLEWVAAVLLLSVLPWNPIYPALRLIAAIGGWMAQPVADKVVEGIVNTQPVDSVEKLEQMVRAG
ncbi:MAG: hypothetical protein EPN47_20610 [Acidobacteria bacterium]|nr:MAG: hypothetical protein EPN47_20610 [Acidobacteriota bacterium]